MSLLKAFQEGGWMMYPILAMGFGMILITVERAYSLYYRMSLNKEHFFKQLTTHLLQGDFEKMISVCENNPAPTSRIMKTCLIRLLNRGSDADLQAALDEGAMMEIPKIEKSIGFLAVIGNVSTLTGLLGTITGLIQSFAGVANSDPATKATMLTKGISEAMNCTAFGLIVAVPSVVLYSLFQSRAQKLIDDLNEISIRTFNFILANRARFGVEEKVA